MSTGCPLAAPQVAYLVDSAARRMTYSRIKHDTWVLWHDTDETQDTTRVNDSLAALSRHGRTLQERWTNAHVPVPFEECQRLEGRLITLLLEVVAVLTLGLRDRNASLLMEATLLFDQELCDGEHAMSREAKSAVRGIRGIEVCPDV